MPGVMLFTGQYYQAPFDEGVKLVARNLYLQLSRLTEVLVATTAADPPEGTHVIPNGPWKFFRAVRRLWNEHRPDAVLYVPDAYLDRFTVVRAAMLARATRGTRVGMLTLMPGRVDWLVRMTFRLWKPAIVFPVTDSETALYRRHGVSYWMLPPAVDTERFCPPQSVEEKRALRRKYGLPEDGKLCLHVGHFRQSRNVEWLARMRLPEGARLLVVGRRSRPGEDDMTAILREHGAIMLDCFIERIEEVYRAVDLYLFPVESDRAATAMPLSVLEAMASNLPVVTTPFGGLPGWFTGVQGMLFARSPEEFEQAVPQALAAQPSRTRAAVESHSWSQLAADILTRLEGRRCG